MKRFGLVLLASLVALCPLTVAAQQQTFRTATRPNRPMQAGRAPIRDDFYLKDGDRVVFYGDSITDQRLYTTYIETYCLTRFPQKNLTFVHSGWGGDRVGGGGGGPIDVRLKRDVLAYKPTVVTICLGMNDGSYRAFDENIFNTYVKGYRHILDTLKQELPGVRITLLTAPAFDDVTRAPNFPGGYNQTLLRYGQAVTELGKEYGYTVADTNAPLVAALTKAKVSNAELAATVIKDRVHPGPGGHMVMAAAVLTAWHAPATVAAIEINAKSKRTIKQDNTAITDLRVTPQQIQFTHTDRALPWPLDRDPERNKDMELTLQSTNYEQALNRYTLKITGLPAKQYTLTIDGMEYGTVAQGDLMKGVDLAALPTLPPNVQAQQVLTLTRKHNDLHFRRWRQVQVPATKNGMEITPEIQKQMDDLDAEEAEVVKQQRDALTIKPHTVALTPLP